MLILGAFVAVPATWRRLHEYTTQAKTRHARKHRSTNTSLYKANTYLLSGRLVITAILLLLFPNRLSATNRASSAEKSQ